MYFFNVKLKTCSVLVDLNSSLMANRVILLSSLYGMIHNGDGNVVTLTTFSTLAEPEVLSSGATSGENNFVDSFVPLTPKTRLKWKPFRKPFEPHDLSTLTHLNICVISLVLRICSVVLRCSKTVAWQVFKCSHFTLFSECMICNFWAKWC